MSDVKYPRHSRMLSGGLHIHEIVMYNISNCSTFNWNSPGYFNIDVFYYWLLSLWHWLWAAQTFVIVLLCPSSTINIHCLDESSLQVHHTAAVMQMLVCVTLPPKSVQIHMGIYTWATIRAETNTKNWIRIFATQNPIRIRIFTLYLCLYLIGCSSP